MRTDGPLLWVNHPYALSRYFGVLDNPGDLGSMRQGNALVGMSHCHHRGSDQGAIIDGGLSQESI
jgi:hypothetical protein